MSGGSYDYAYRHVEEFADALESGLDLRDRAAGADSRAERIAFAAHLRKVAAAMKAIEWVDSFDCSPPHDSEAIAAVMRPLYSIDTATGEVTRI